MSVHILGISGSLRPCSKSRQALELALRGATLAGARTTLLDLQQLQLPLYDDRDTVDTYPRTVFTYLEAVRGADGLLLSTPVYHGILSGALKNALDFLELLWNDERPWLEGKMVGLISVAGGRAGDNALNSMRFACDALHAHTVPTAVSIPGTAFSETGTLEDSRIEERLLRLGHEVTDWASRLAGHPQAAAAI